MCSTTHTAIFLSLSVFISSLVSSGADNGPDIKSNLITSDPKEVRAHDELTRISGVTSVSHQQPLPAALGPLLPPLPVYQMAPMPLPMPIVLPSRAVYEPVYHDHPSWETIQRIIKKGKRRDSATYEYDSDYSGSREQDSGSSDRR